MIDRSLPVFRFAPSPNGELHLGHAFSALLNLKQAREAKGKCLLRIEDIDTVRCTPELEKQMLEDLEWIGFEWDEPPRRQSEHFDEYRETVDQLLATEIAYPSLLSRTEIRKTVAALRQSGEPWPDDPDGAPVYPGKERTLSNAQKTKILASSQSFNIRLDVSKALLRSGARLSWLETGTGKQQAIAANPARWGDVVLARKDVPASYHLCCVMDDARQGITHVTRGKDLYEATAVHVLLQSILGLPSPVYHHHALISGTDGRKLSKSEKSKSIRQLRLDGATSGHLRAMLLPEFSGSG